MSELLYSFSKVFVITSSLLIGACGSGSSDNTPDPIDITQQDGPWNWTSQIHQDTYPNDGFIAPNQENNHLDARGDLNEGQSQWVDIIEVRFEFR